jgi:hypothetical protein
MHCIAFILMCQTAFNSGIYGNVLSTENVTRLLTLGFSDICQTWSIIAVNETAINFCVQVQVVAYTYSRVQLL